MNLLSEAWVPVQAKRGIGAFHLLTYRQLLCEAGDDWHVSLPRDDLELACLQLLICMTQVMFLPDTIQMLRARLRTPLTEDEFEVGIAPYHEWFDLDHPTQPFMQSRGVKAADETPIQKLLIGLPEGNNHAFFNEAGEVRHLGGALAAISLFNQASNCPSFGGGFKGSLRGGAPITTLVFGSELREIIWRNVLTRTHLATRKISMPGPQEDVPTWVRPVAEKSTIQWNDIGLVRGLFWQPARVELVKSAKDATCGVLGGAPVSGYSSFRKEKFNYTIDGVWPHPHGVMNISVKKGQQELKFASFTTTAPAWTQLSEMTVPNALPIGSVKEGSVPAEAVTQAGELGVDRLGLLIGGYRTNQASVLERRHELISLAQGWRDDKSRLPKLVEIGREAKTALRGKLFFAAQGHKDKDLKGIGVKLYELAEKLYYARTEGLIHQTFSNELTWKEWALARARFADAIANHCKDIFEELTKPYAAKPELIPIIAWSWRTLNADLRKLTEDAR